MVIICAILVVCGILVVIVFGILVVFICGILVVISCGILIVIACGNANLQTPPSPEVIIIATSFIYKKD